MSVDAHAPASGAAAAPVVTPADDAVAIEELRAAFAAQREAFGRDRFPSLQVRRGRIEALMGMMLANRERIADALVRDFGAHPRPASDLIEVFGVLGRAQHVLQHLEAWMAPAPREVDSAAYGSAQAYVQAQPKGVVGAMVPWNFPFDLSVGPMIEMLAAGDRVILKPSDHTPACAALLREMVSASFDPDLVYVAVGGVDLARMFATLPWDHLLYTGNPEIGRQVMQAAALNLTPVTLELGGKCPALLTPGSVNATNVESVIGTKTVKNGQMCVSVDYCLVPRAEVDAFVAHAQAYMRDAVPGYSRGPDCTGVISLRHLDRLQALLQEARDRQSRIVTLDTDDGVDRQARRMPISLVVDPDPDLRILHEEIFGPILPVVPYDELEQALDYINGGERPLGLYVFGDDAALTRHVLDRTSSGGAAINTCAMQSALPSLGFGGSGLSGMGRHHGHAGFQEFSNPRGVFVRGDGDVIAAFYAPYARAQAMLAASSPGAAAAPEQGSAAQVQVS